MAGAEHAHKVEDIAHELDMIVFKLEQPPLDDSVEGLELERRRVRRGLEKLRERLQDLAEDMR